MTTLQLVRALTVEDLAEMETGELETLVQLGTAVLAVRAEPAPKRQRQECIASKPVKLNVGGSYFSTSLENLTREQGTFFAAMFSGRWEVPVDPKDDAVFIDRDPTVFAQIVNYLRTGKIALGNLTLGQREALREEADFYRIESLLTRLPMPTFCQWRGKVKLSQKSSRASSTEVGSASFMLSSETFSPDVQEMKVKLIKGKRILFGAAPMSILDNGKRWSDYGWYIWCLNGSLCGQNGDTNKPFKHKIEEGNVVTVKLDSEFNISFAVDGEDWGVAFPKVAEDYSTPLHLCVMFLDSIPVHTAAEERIVELQ